MRQLLSIAVLSLFFAPAIYAGTLPRPDHVVVVIEENRGYAQIIDKLRNDSYIHNLIRRGTLFTQSFGVTHPSQPNYLALFSGSTQGIGSNACPNTFDTDNLATALQSAGLSFISYADSLPATGDLVCMAGAYQRKHNPATNWQGTRLRSDINRRFADFPRDFSKLPTVSFVIPDQDHDMHDGGFSAADNWLKTHIGPYVEWAFQHNSLLIITWDEDNYLEDNHIVTLLVGPMVRPGESAQRIDHYHVLRTLLDFYGLPPLGASLDAEAIENIWK
ncbi:MAG TPA: alkaline phosphatase family protein [Gallionella sp.]|nr:alkaline phosphatase family protein [Gallionella sp.]